ncbi:MAG: peptidoglycan glycosyltransferase, partial [Clostridiaceae bacterium]|nr:peptidoglycan glycosyltransferase [Clostridiaceae bacterium]
MQKRIKRLLIFFTISIILLAIRFYILQVLHGEKLSISAAVQKISDSQVQIPRGSILDKNLIPFTNRIKKIDLIIKPLYLKENDTDISKIASITGINPSQLKREIGFKKEPIIIEIDESKKKLLLDENIQGISFIHSLRRYDNNPLAIHVLGYLNKADYRGETGIEKMYEDNLKINGKNSVAVITD